MADITFKCKIPDPDVFRSVLDDYIMKSYMKHMEDIENFVKTFLSVRYGITTLDKCEEIVKKKQLRLCYDTQYNFYGIIANSRWLYTVDGYIVGKKGKNFDFNNTKGRWL